jgi:methyl-accepting chemotaxis protein
MSQITQQTASSSEELAATAEEMTAQAATLQDLMRFFTVAKQRGPSDARRPAPVKLPAQPRRRDAVRSATEEATFERF